MTFVVSKATVTHEKHPTKFLTESVAPGVCRHMCTAHMLKIIFNIKVGMACKGSWLTVILRSCFAEVAAAVLVSIIVK